MTPRRRAILIVTLAAIALLGLILLILWLLRQFRPEPAPPVPEPTVQEQPAPVVEPTVVLANPLTPPRPPLPEQRVAAVQLAELFAERYGSYSSHSPYSNLRDLLPVMTASYRAKTEAQLEAAESDAPPGTYEGVTSIKVSTTVVTYDESGGRSRIDVALQQTVTKGSQETISYRTLKVWVIQEGDDWKVDAVEWTR